MRFSPAGVNRTDRALRSKSVVLIVLSSLRMAWLTALGVRWSSFAASRNEPVRAAASKARIAEVGTLESNIPISEPDSSIQDNYAFVGAQAAAESISEQ